MPHDGAVTPTPESAALTILIGEADKVFFYHGNWDEALMENRVLPTTLDLKTGLGKIIREKQQWLDRNPVNGEDRKGLMVLIKAGEKADYSQVIDVLDEMLINNVRKYAIINPSPDELKFIYRRTK